MSGRSGHGTQSRFVLQPYRQVTHGRRDRRRRRVLAMKKDNSPKQDHTGPAARALWKGAISFGLVNVPVELFPAEERKTFKFSMLDKRDLSPVGYKRYSKSSGREVEWDDIVKGYEYEKEQYVVLSDEDFRKANPKATQTIDIKAFIAAGELAAEYYETPYYLAPAVRGQKVYALLRETLRATSRIAIAQVVIRQTEHLAAVVVNGNALMLITLRYQNELRDTKGLELPAAGLKDAGVTAKEVELAKRLVDDMTESWKPNTFRSTYQDDLMTRIRQKIKAGQTKVITPPEGDDDDAPRSAEIIDLADLLKRSLGSKLGGKAVSTAVTSRRPALKIVKRTAVAKSAAKRKRA
ncbi:MAG: Ku protein [Casimicrobiaceae bacterium]